MSIGGLTREEQNWIRQEENDRRAKDGLPPLRDLTAIEELKMLRDNVVSLLRRALNVVRCRQ
jgi:hypothetical protein